MASGELQETVLIVRRHARVAHQCGYGVLPPTLPPVHGEASAFFQCLVEPVVPFSTDLRDYEKLVRDKPGPSLSDFDHCAAET